MVTWNQMDTVTGCPNTSDPKDRHSVVRLYRRRARDWFRKSYWFRCFNCDGEWPVTEEPPSPRPGPDYGAWEERETFFIAECQSCELHDGKRLKIPFWDHEQRNVWAHAHSLMGEPGEHEVKVYTEER